MKTIVLLIFLLVTVPAMSFSRDGSSFKNCDEFQSFALKMSHKLKNDSANTPEDRLFKYKVLSGLLSEEASKCTSHLPSMKLMALLNVSAFQNGAAILYAQYAVSAAPLDAEANDILGTVYGLIYDFEKGLPYLEKAASLDPKYEFDLCSNYELAGQYKKAIEACSKSIKIETQKERIAPSYYVRGRAHQALDMDQKAKVDFEHSKLLGFNGDEFYSSEHMGK